MVIDGARNSTHDVFSVNAELFEFVFPNDTDVSFVDEVEERIKSLGIDEITFFDDLYSNPVDKKKIIGLHGILHSTGSYCRKEYFPSRKEAEVVNH